jgi:ketosteroid isomerase-like protein
MALRRESHDEVLPHRHRPVHRTLEPLSIEGREVRVYGDTAISLGAAHLRGQWRDRKLDRHYRYTNVYVLRDGRWQAVTSQVTGID